VLPVVDITMPEHFNMFDFRFLDCGTRAARAPTDQFQMSSFARFLVRHLVSVAPPLPAHLSLQSGFIHAGKREDIF
jgi:hypothetical protein